MNSSSEHRSSATVKDLELDQTGEVVTGDKEVDNELSLDLAEFTFRDSIDLDVIRDFDTSTSRIDADEEDNADHSQQQQIQQHQRQQQKTAKTACSTPVTSTQQQKLPKSILRSGKIFRRSKSSESLLDNKKYKIVTVENKDKRNQVNFNFEENSNKTYLVQKHLTQSQTTQNTNFSKMVDVGAINALVSNNIPILTGELSANLRSEVNVFVKCCERIEACLTGNAEKNIFMQLLGTRFRARAAEAIEGTYCVTVADLKKALNEKLLQNRQIRFHW